MNKRIIALGIASMLIFTGCNGKKTESNTIGENGVENKATEEQVVIEEEVVTDSSEIVFMKPTSETIDFSGLKFVKGETEPNKVFETIVKDIFFKDTDEFNYSYTYNYVDLNGDEFQDALVLLVGIEFSGSGGSTALILQGVENGFKPLSTMTLVNAPIIISDKKTSDYRDIIINVYGGGAEGSFNLMEFDGKGYPKNPSVAPLVEEGSIITGEAIIANDDYYKNFININVELSK